MTEKKIYCNPEGGYASGSICVCYNGYYGAACSEIVSDCKEAYEMGWNTVQYYFKEFTLKPKGTDKKFKVMCITIGETAGYSVIMKRQRSKCPDTFDQTVYSTTYQAYKDGFGDTNCNWFVGLEAMYALVTLNRPNAVTKLYIKVGSTLKAWYSPFYMANSSFMFAADFSHYVAVDSTLPDSLAQPTSGATAASHNRPFSLGADNTCNKEVGVGWWYNMCTAVNLFTDLMVWEGISQADIDDNVLMLVGYE